MRTHRETDACNLRPLAAAAASCVPSCVACPACCQIAIFKKSFGLPLTPRPKSKKKGGAGGGGKATRRASLITVHWDALEQVK